MTEHTSTELRESWHVEIKSDGYQEKVTLTAYVDLARIIQIQGCYVEDVDNYRSGPLKYVFLDHRTGEKSAELREWLRTGVDWDTWDPYDFSMNGVYQGREFLAEVVFLWDEVMRIDLRMRDYPHGESMEYWDVELVPELSEKDGVRCWKLTGVSTNPPE